MDGNVINVIKLLIILITVNDNQVDDDDEQCDLKNLLNYQVKLFGSSIKFWQLNPCLS